MAENVDIDIEGFEGEKIRCSKFTEKVGQNYIDYKFEYENNLKIIKSQQDELETYKKIAEKIAEYTCPNILIPKCSGCNYENDQKCVECVIDWARKEVE